MDPDLGRFSPRTSPLIRAERGWDTAGSTAWNSRPAARFGSPPRRAQVAARCRGARDFISVGLEGPAGLTERLDKGGKKKSSRVSDLTLSTSDHKDHNAVLSQGAPLRKNGGEFGKQALAKTASPDGTHG